MVKLKQIDLLRGRDFYYVKLPGVAKVNCVHNDYHSKKSNPGYARGELGRRFPK
jgi:hypothetical protein